MIKIKRGATPTIVHVVSGDLWGGAEAQVADLLRELQSRPDLKIAAVLMNEGLLSRRLAGAGIKVLVLDESRMHLGQLFRNAARFASAQRPCIFHSHRRREHVLAALLALRYRTHCVASVHGPLDGNGPKLSPSQRFREWVHTAVMRHLHSKVIAVSDELGTQLQARHGRDKIVVIRNGLGGPWSGRDTEPQRLSPSTAAAARAPRRIAFFGRLAPVKRLDLFIAACRILADRRPGGYLFHIYGTGMLRAGLEAQSSQLGLTQLLSFEGFTEDPRTHIREVDCIVLTSEREGLPMIAMEALDCGVPVVCPAVGGLPQLIAASGGFGELVHDRSAEAFANAIERTLRDHPKEIRGSRLPLEYSVAASAEHYAALYGQLCAPA